MRKAIWGILMRNGDRNGGPNVTTRIEARYAGSAYVVLTLNARTSDHGIEEQLRLASHEEPALYDLVGTAAANVSNQDSFIGQASPWCGRRVEIR